MLEILLFLLFVFTLQCGVETLPKRWHRLSTKKLSIFHASKRLKLTLTSDVVGLFTSSLRVPLISLAGLFIVQEVYLNLPLELLYRKKPELIKEIDIKNNPDGLVLIFPGFGGIDANIDNLKKKLIDSDRRNRIRRQIIVYDWSQYRGNILRAAINSESIGHIIGNQIANEIKTAKCDVERFKLQFIGISVGAFAGAKASEKCKEYYNRLTLLDPFTQRGLFGFNYGINEFGKLLTSEKTFFEQFMNTDDAVPSTNSPIQKSLCYDCTKSKQKLNYIPLSQDVPGHAFPVVYYTKNYDRIRKIDSHNISKQYNRGEIIIVE